MMIGPDFEALIAEAAISVEAAHVAAKSFSQHRVVVSADVAAMIRFLDEAAECVARVRTAEGGDAARAALTASSGPEGAKIRIVREGAGRATIKPVNDNL